MLLTLSRVHVENQVPKEKKGSMGIMSVHALRVTLLKLQCLLLLFDFRILSPIPYAATRPISKPFNWLY